MYFVDGILQEWFYVCLFAYFSVLGLNPGTHAYKSVLYHGAAFPAHVGGILNF
jgi:hypothetical protein